jgi:hypothetical protein
MQLVKKLLDKMKAEGMLDEVKALEKGDSSSNSVKRDNGKGLMGSALNSEIMAMLKQDEKDKAGKVKMKKGGLVKKAAAPAAKSRTNALNKYYGK